jgi:hypothetical protein
MFRPSWSGRVRGSKAWKEKALEGRNPRRVAIDRNGSDVTLREELAKVLRIGKTTGDGSPTFPVNP